MKNSIKKMSKIKKEKNKRIVSYKKFYKFLKKQLSDTLMKNFTETRSLIEIENALEIAKDRFTVYKSPDTNKQFCSIHNSDIIFLNKLNEMLSFFCYK